MISKDFYIAYGNLLYAVAMSDGAVQKKEKETILHLVKSKLVPLEDVKDEDGTDLAYYTAFSFETADDTIADVETALQHFIDFVKEKRKKINEEHLQVMKDILLETAKSFGRITKKEQEIIDTFVEMLELA
ncbi:MAG: hypothetical protein SNJ77_11555 [Cytophagales bacterium]